MAQKMTRICAGIVHMQEDAEYENSIQADVVFVQEWSDDFSPHQNDRCLGIE